MCSWNHILVVPCAQAPPAAWQIHHHALEHRVIRNTGLLPKTCCVCSDKFSPLSPQHVGCFTPWYPYIEHFPTLGSQSSRTAMKENHIASPCIGQKPQRMGHFSTQEISPGDPGDPGDLPSSVEKFQKNQKINMAAGGGGRHQHYIAKPWLSFFGGVRWAAKQELPPFPLQLPALPPLHESGGWWHFMYVGRAGGSGGHGHPAEGWDPPHESTTCTVWQHQKLGKLYYTLRGAAQHRYAVCSGSPILLYHR